MNLDPAHRFQHRYILGKTGVGKSTLMLALMLEDIAAGDGLFYIDPHGQDADRLLEYIPESRRRDVILFDPSNLDQPQPINVLADVADEWRPFIASYGRHIQERLGLSRRTDTGLGSGLVQFHRSAPRGAQGDALRHLANADR